MGSLDRGGEGEGLQRERPRELAVDRGSEIDWGRYEAAIRRWESVTRPAPAPVDDRGRLSPRFTEWMMAFPDGWVSDILAHGPALKACGNGVVTPQAVEALHRLLAVEFTENPSGESITIKKKESA